MVQQLPEWVTWYQMTRLLNVIVKIAGIMLNLQPRIGSNTTKLPAKKLIGRMNNSCYVRPGCLGISYGINGGLSFESLRFRIYLWRITSTLGLPSCNSLAK